MFPKKDLILPNLQVVPNFYPNLLIFLHRYICHICDISQLCFPIPGPAIKVNINNTCGKSKYCLFNVHDKTQPWKKSQYQKYTNLF